MLFRFSLVLTLAATQLLAGSSRAVYLCVSSDGGICCFDAGPEYCTCCQHSAEASADLDTACAVKTETCDTPCCDHDHEAGLSADQPAHGGEDQASLSGGPCDCEHELVSTGQAASVMRTSVTAQFALNVQLWSLTPALADALVLPAMGVEGPGNLHGPPLASEAALAVAATVVMRC